METIVRTYAADRAGACIPKVPAGTASRTGNAGAAGIIGNAGMFPFVPDAVPAEAKEQTAAAVSAGTAGQAAASEKTGELQSPRGPSGREESLPGKMGIKLFGPSSQIRTAECPDTGDFLRFMKKLYETAGTKDPREVARMLDIIVSDLTGSITGFATAIRTEGDRMMVPVIGLNEKLEEGMYIATGAHEIAHVVDGHVYAASSGSYMDEGSIFRHGIDSRCLSWDEKRCNLAAADICLEDEDVFRVTGYDNCHMRRYRELMAQQKLLSVSPQRCLQAVPYSDGSVYVPEKTRIRAEAYWKSVRELGEHLREEEAFLAQLNLVKSFSEIAAELGTTETILHYKLEAMRLRGLDIDRQELASYNRVFENALERSREYRSCAAY